MDARKIIHDHLTECARVYLFFSKENTNFYLINCLFCNKDYSDWLKFNDHLENVHQLENTQLKQNENNIPIEDWCAFKSETQEEKIQLDNSGPNKKFSSSDDNSSPNEREKSLLLLKNDLECTDVEFLDEYLTDNLQNLKENPVIPEEQTPKATNSCFFRLYTTDSQIMLKFIALLRQHPCQWNHKQNNFTLKEKRLESTLRLTKQLKENLNINITPQGLRASILYLLRWFDREYIRYLNCQQNDFKFVSMHSEYFEKLLEFLPRQHLKPMTCDECSKNFKSEHLLMAHRHKYHNGQVPFRCRYCGHGFIHLSSHQMHENRHIKIHVWPCKICRYQATSKSDYIKHLATHSSQQPHKCSICGLCYKTKTNLNVHLKSHSLPNYECEFCKRKFYEKYRYKRHIWQHEEQEMTVKAVDNFTCEICGRRFTSNKTLIKHQMVHIQENYKIEDDFYKLTDIVVYFCGYCSLEFSYKEAYETHMHIKHNVKKR